MNSENLKVNELKILTHLLTRLEKRIYLLRISLYGSTDKYCPDSSLPSEKMLEFIEREEIDDTHNLHPEDYRLIVDSCDIETSLRRIMNELMNRKTFHVLKEVVREFESENKTLKTHKKLLEGMRKQIEQVKQKRGGIQEHAQVITEHLKSKKFEATKVKEEKLGNFEELTFLKKLMDYKLKSRRNYYEHLKTEIQKKIQRHEGDVQVQAHADIQLISFWLLKYDAFSESVDMLLRQMFDNWASKRRDLEVIKKFRRLNLQKIQDLQKLLAEKEAYIENYRQKKEIEQKKKEEELRREAAAIILQAAWRGTMVRKQLGPYKIKKPTKGKGKKGKKEVGKKKK